MNNSSQVFQLIFVVDLSLSKELKFLEKSASKLSLIISRTTLKLLTHFSSLVSKEQNIRWGYKFFNAGQTLRKSHQDLVEFSSKSFEKYENDLRSKLESEEHGNPEPETSGVGDNEGCEALQRVLSDITCDFQWERPDICSPVKFKSNPKKRKQTENLDSPNQNIVFLFSCCPHSLGDALTYLDCDSQCPEDALDALIPKKLRQQFHAVRQLKLVWIDVDAAPNQQQGSHQVICLDLSCFCLIF